MKRFQKHKALPGLLATAAVALLLIACALAPVLLFSRYDKATFNHLVLRQQESGGLSPGAQYIYLLGALRGRAAAQRAGGASPGETTPLTAQEAIDDLSGLAAAGVFSPAMLKALEGLLTTDGVVCTATPDGLGVTRVYCDLSPIAPYAITYEKEASTGLVIRCWLSGTLPGADFPEGPPPAEALNAYLAYTSLSVVYDWQPASGFYAAALRSEGRGLLAYHDGGLTFGLVVDPQG